METTILLIAAVLVFARVGAEYLLGHLNLRHSARHAEKIPEALSEVMDEATYAKSVAYTQDKGRLGQWETLWDGLILALVLFSGLLPRMWEAAPEALRATVWGQAIFLFGVGLLLSLPSLPFEWVGTFRVEERHGFNRTTPALWISDKIKGLIIGVILGYPLLLGLVSLIGKVPFWWLWAAGGWMAFQFLLVVLFPVFILPLFNKLTPLPEGDLKDRLLATAEKARFPAKTILVMDGSKRSGHANAFFTGFGKARRIVLFDTLIDKLSEAQLDGVLAHEIGHFRLGHIRKMIFSQVIFAIIGFAVLGFLAASPEFLGTFGFEPLTDGSLPAAPALLLFALLSGSVTFWLGPLANILSRKHEYEADAYAAELTGEAAPLRQSLRKLTEANLSNLTPHPWFSFFHYSHPTLPERDAALAKLEKPA